MHTEKKRIPGMYFFKRNIGTIIGLILLIIVVTISTPRFLTTSNILNLLKSNSVNAIISCGMLMAILMGEIDISVGSTVGLSGIIGAYMMTNMGLPVGPTICICLMVGALVGIVNGIAISYLKVPAFVATLATQSIGRGLTEIISGGVTIRVRDDSYTAIGNTSIGGISVIIIYAAVILVFTWFLLNRTRFGYYIYAIGGNKLAAQYSGVNVKKYNMLPYVLIGLFCGLSGLIWSARLGSAAATLGSGFEMDAIAAVVIGGTSMSGGVGTVGGTFIGVLIIGVITNGLNLMGINSFWQEVFKGIIILVAVVIDVVRKTCAYTNHTILAEALEKWPISYLEQVVPHLLPIIRELDSRVRRDFHDERVYIIDKQDRVHMAHIDIHFGYAVNGVAALHTEILKESELKPFYDIYPEKFNNKTNGITFRRWLLHCNQELSAYIEELIGDGFKENAMELEKLLAYKDDEKVLKRLMEIKHHAKEHLRDYLKETQNVEINDDSVFDIQIKRLHEYKRQQMNALYAIYKYKEIKKGNLPKRPITMIFGAKAAPAYTIAKDIIHLLLCLQQLIDNDPVVSKYMKLVMVENYNVPAIFPSRFPLHQKRRQEQET